MNLMLRYPSGSDIKARLKRLAEVIKLDADFRTMRITPSSVMRMALDLGVEALEKQYEEEL